MRVIALFGRGNIGKTRCLGHLINLIYSEEKGCNYLFEGEDTRVTLDYKGRSITICTWGDNEYEEQLNIDKIQQDKPDIAVVATRTKGGTVELVEKYCKEHNCPLKWVEKYVASFDDRSGQEHLNNQQAEQMLDYIRGLVEGQLYYVESITEIRLNEENGGRYHVTLLGTDMPEEGFPRTLSLELNDNQLYLQGTEQRIQEDDFVLYRPDSELRFFNGNETHMAATIRNESRDLRGELAFRKVQGENAFALIERKPTDVRSYHVNVGHGNCSLILLASGTKYELWMVDCSTYDYLRRRDYSQDLYHCLSDIAMTLNIGLEDLRISRFMLTHTHFDHYNGLRYLIKHGFVDDKTLVYANLYYDCASPVWNDILKELLTLRCGFVEPTASILNEGAIRVFHPECRLYKRKKLIDDSRVVSEVNNSSVVYGIELGGHLMVLPGDLEKKGFKEMSSHRPCIGNLSRATYYVISHHGSLNGHPDGKCMNPGAPQPSPLNCVSLQAKRAILMGRNGAYPGIYSSEVTSYWESVSGRLVKTEDAKHYVEIEWVGGNVRMK